MNNTELTINADEVRRMFADLQSRDRKKVFKKTIKCGLDIIKRATVNNLKRCINPRMISHRDRWGNSFRKGIKTKVYRDNNGGLIHIMGNFKLKFFELGTQERYNKSKHTSRLKKKRYTGKIPAYHFFKHAKESKQQEVINSIDSLISQSIHRINNRHR